MKLVFFGTADFAVPALEAVADSTVLVVSQPDRPSGRGLTLHPSPVKKVALDLGIPVATPEKSRSSEFVELVKGLRADAHLVAAYGQILSRPLLESSHRGAFNLHGSILPRYRGAAPIQRSIANGDVETGVTLMQMDIGMDTGDIIAIERTVIGNDETAGDLFVRLADIAGQMARDWMPRLTVGDYTRTPQSNELATYAPKIEKAEAELNVRQAAKSQYDKFRGFTPSPGAFVRTVHGHMRISKARLREHLNIGPGTVALTPDGLMLGFLEGAMSLLEVQPEGKKRMSGLDFANGARLKTSDCLVP